MENLNKVFLDYVNNVSLQGELGVATAFLNHVSSHGTILAAELAEDMPDGYLAVMSGASKYYAVFTNREEAEFASAGTIVEKNLDELVEKCLATSEIKGFCINPYNPSPCLISRYYIQAMIMAEKGAFDDEI